MAEVNSNNVGPGDEVHIVEDGDVENEDDDRSSSSDDETEEEVEVEDPLTAPTRKRKVPSPIWECGGMKVDGGSKCCVVLPNGLICGKLFKSTTRNTSNIIKHILDKHKNSEEGRMLKEKVESKKRKLEEQRKVKEARKKETKAFTQSSILSFTNKSSALDPIKKKKIDEAIIKFVVVENQPFGLIEKHSFRELIFAAEPGYVCPSETKFRHMFDSYSEKQRTEFVKELQSDFEGVEVKCVQLTSDHGTSHDRFRSHKNVLTISRTTKDFCIKTDLVQIIDCSGSQTGEVIREDVKRCLDKIGRSDDWIIDWVTDGESKQVSARGVGRHPGVNMKTHVTGTCVDHTAHLAVEEALDKAPAIKKTTSKVRSFINHLKDSHLLKEAFKKTMDDAGVEPLAIIQGTSNRWYYKFLEVKRVLVLRPHVQKFQEDQEGFDDSLCFDEDDWKNLTIYFNSLKTLADNSDMLEGQNYPTASSVIPFIDQVFSELTTLVSKLSEEDGKYPKALLTALQGVRRFPNGYKSLAPYNVLTLLDPRYMDIYFSSEEMKKAVEDLAIDAVYDSVAPSQPGNNNPPPPVVANPSSNTDQTQSSFARRRAELLASKAPTPAVAVVTGSLKARLEAEIDRFLLLRGTVNPDQNPQAWWKQHCTEFPLLARYWRAHCAFPATSTHSERVYNIEGLVVTSTRKNLDPTRSGHLCACRDFLLQRQAKEAFRLCKQCPQPPSSSCCYIISCRKHNQ